MCKTLIYNIWKNLIGCWWTVRQNNSFEEESPQGWDIIIFVGEVYVTTVMITDFMCHYELSARFLPLSSIFRTRVVSAIYSTVSKYLHSNGSKDLLQLCLFSMIPDSTRIERPNFLALQFLLLSTLHPCCRQC